MGGFVDIYEQVLFSWRPFGNNRHLGAESAWGIAVGSRDAAAKRLWVYTVLRAKLIF